jgi:hypothetical protein
MARPAVECDFDRKWRPLDQVVGNFRRNQSTVGKKGYQQSFLPGIGIDIEEIFAQENLSAGHQQPQAAGRRDFIYNVTPFSIGKFALTGVLIIDAQVIVAMGALIIATPGELNGPAERYPVAAQPLVDAQTPICVFLDFHIS